MSEPQDISLGEVGRRVDRMEKEMREGFQSMREEIRQLAFVPAAVYTADRSASDERVRRLESDLSEETQAREAAQERADQRSWQARFSLIMALVGLPLSIVASIVAALVITQLR